jgi:hypothetical protein
MYLFLNHFAFTEPKNGITESDVFNALENLAKLFIELKNINADLIIHQSLSQTILIGKPLREYLKSISDSNVKKSIVSLIGKIKPICSDIDTPYDDNENIIFGNCVEEKGDIDVLQTFLSCAIYYNDPILTVNNLCSKAQFLENSINIVCDTDSYQLDNYKLIPYTDVLKNIKDYQERTLISEYNKIDNWNDYKDFINNHFEYSRITDHCIEMLNKKIAYSSSHAKDFRNKVKRIDELIIREGGNPKKIDFNQLSQKHYAPESDTSYKDLQKSHSNILNYKNEYVYLNWHTWVQDFRMYFEKEDEYVSFIHFEKKIT